MFARKILLLLLSALLVTACAPAVPLQRDQTASFSKGTAIDDADKLTGKATVTASYDFDSNGRHYLAKHFNLQTGTTETMGMVCSPICIAYPIYVPVFVSYVMIYEAGSKKLLAWGTVEELSRSPDENVSSIMPDLKSRFTQEMAKKKSS